MFIHIYHLFVSRYKIDCTYVFGGLKKQNILEVRLDSMHEVYPGSNIRYIYISIYLTFAFDIRHIRCKVFYIISSSFVCIRYTGRRKVIRALEKIDVCALEISFTLNFFPSFLPFFLSFSFCFFFSFSILTRPYIICISNFSNRYAKYLLFNIKHCVDKVAKIVGKVEIVRANEIRRNTLY